MEMPPEGKGEKLLQLVLTLQMERAAGRLV